MPFSPRQTGKTTCLLDLIERLNSEGSYLFLYINLEAARSARKNVNEAMGVDPGRDRREGAGSSKWREPQRASCGFIALMGAAQRSELHPLPLGPKSEALACPEGKLQAVGIWGM